MSFGSNSSYTAPSNTPFGQKLTETYKWVKGSEDRKWALRQLEPLLTDYETVLGLPLTAEQKQKCTEAYRSLSNTERTEYLTTVAFSQAVRESFNDMINNPQYDSNGVLAISHEMDLKHVERLIENVGEDLFTPVQRQRVLRSVFKDGSKSYLEWFGKIKKEECRIKVKMLLEA